jgi:hypothetical protein
MIEAKGPGVLGILKEAEARLAKDRDDPMGNNVINKIIRQGQLQVDAAKISGNRAIIWFCHDQEAIDKFRIMFKEYGRGLEHINFFHLP